MNAQDEIRAALPEDKRYTFDAWVTTINDQTCELAKTIEGLVEERDDLQEQVKSLEQERNADEDDRERVLTTVRYWLHDILVLQKPISPCPRQILREVEGVL